MHAFGWTNSYAGLILPTAFNVVGVFIFRQAMLAIPDDYEVVDVGPNWVSPGMIGLHCHAAGESLFMINDLNDMVYLTNPGVRASASVVPGVHTMKMALAGGVTSVLYIPGLSDAIEQVMLIFLATNAR